MSDVAAISNYHFNIAWRYLRMNGSRRLSVDERTGVAWDAHVKVYIYWGLSLPTLLRDFPFGIQWLKAISRMSLIDPTKGHDVNLRIYADYEALRGLPDYVGKTHERIAL